MTTLVSETQRAVPDSDLARGRLGLRWVYPAVEGGFFAFPRQGAALRLGRDPSADVPLPGQQVSWAHAEIVPGPAGPILRDKGSTNGTRVDGVAVKDHLLQAGDVVRIGDHVAIVAFEPADRSRPAFARLPSGLLAGPVLQAVMQPALELAGSDLPIILEGETGCGKEVLARWIHETSGRRGPFVALNCAALPENLAEAELFGHSKGAFTGAVVPDVDVMSRSSSVRRLRKAVAHAPRLSATWT